MTSFYMGKGGWEGQPWTPMEKTPLPMSPISPHVRSLRHSKQATLDKACKKLKIHNLGTLC